MVTWGVILWGIVALAQDPPVPGSAEAEADAAIAEFKRNFYRPGSTEDELALAVRTLGQTVHPKTLAVLVPLMNESRGPFATAPVSTRIAAALVLAGFGKIDGTPEALINAYKFNTRPASRPVRIQIIQTLGELKAESAGGLINAAILLDRDPWIVRAAVKAAGRLRGSSSIDPLIKRLQYLESKEGERPSDVPDPAKDGRSAGDLDRHRKSERQVLQAPIHEALNSITRQRQTCADTWAKWWAQNRKDYKVPP